MGGGEGSHTSNYLFIDLFLRTPYQVDPETYRVTADGEHLTCEPLQELPLAQRFFVF
jgi:urease alpha subunit